MVQSLKPLVLLLVCPLWAPLLHLYSLHHTHWRTKATLLKTVQGLLSSGPQLVLQLSLFMRGTLTLPVVSLLHQTSNTTGLLPHPDQQDQPLELFGRDYDVSDRYYLGLIQLGSILCSFLSVLTSVLHFNEFETGHGVSVSRLCLGLPFFLLTIIYRAVSLSLTVCFLHWWASVLIFLLLFLPVLASMCAGDSFPRSCLYGLWSLLAPVGYSRSPLVPLGYNPLHHSTMAQEEDQVLDREDKNKVSARTHYFLSCHLICSLAIMGPALVLVTALVQRAALLPDSLHVRTQAIFPLQTLSSVFLPLLGMALGVTLLLAQPYRHIRDCGKGRLTGQ